MKHYLKLLNLATIAILALLCCVGCSQQDVHAGHSEKSSNAESVAQAPLVIEEATVERVVDGDTIIVDIDGVRERVRLKGIDCPESVHPDASKNTQAGINASDYTKSVLQAGDTVYLEADPNYDDRDKYDRLLRYVWLIEPDPNSAEHLAYIQVNMLQGKLLSDGYADVYVYKQERFKYRQQFERLQ